MDLVHPTATDEARSSDRSGKPVVLVVEDEPLLRVVAVEMVKDAGLDAIGVVDAAAALHVLGWRRDVRIVFSDIEMPPGMDGLQLASMIRKRWPGISTILTSGRRHPKAEELGDSGIFFAKPYEAPQIVETMRRLAA